MRFGLKVLFTITTVMALLLCLAPRMYSLYMPHGMSADSRIPYISHSYHAGTITSPEGVPYHLYVNDAGAMHSGNHWTWVVRDDVFYGRRLIAEGYLDAFQIDEIDSLPITWKNGEPEIPFCATRY